MTDAMAPGANRSPDRAEQDNQSGSIDPIALSVLWNALIAVADDMGLTLRRTAYSAAVREGDDFSTGLFDRHGRLIAQGNFSPGHLGAMPYVVRHVIEHYDDDPLGPGDCVLLNDSFMGSGHYPDFFLTTPLFHDEQLIGYAVNCAHHVDVGGAVPGSQIVDVTEAYQEGLRILPIRIARRGVIQEEILRLILGNVRLPEIVRGDLFAQRNANAVAEERLQKLYAKYGDATISSAIEAILERSEQRMRQLIGALPDGRYEYEDVMDDSGNNVEPIRFHVAVVVSGDSLELDWSGSSDQVSAGINAYINYTRAYSSFAIKVFTDPLLPQNDGVNRPIAITAREGSFFNPRYPAPSSGRAAVQIRLFEVVCGALGKVVPDRAMASFSHWSNPIMGGIDPHSGEQFVFYDLIYGGYGARATHDGEESLCPVFNATNIPIEIHEAESPVRIRQLSLMTDTAGPGRFRGGSGLRKDIELLAAEARVSLSGDRHRFAPPGADGGGSGAIARTVLNPDTDPVELGSKQVRSLCRGDVLSIQLSGAGGYGDPHQRERNDVRRDIDDGYVSREAAASVYGIDDGHD